MFPRLRCFALAIFVATPIEAQSVAVGTRVRVTSDAIGRWPVEGIVTASTADSTVLVQTLPREWRRVRRDTIALARGTITKLETHVGRRRNMLKDMTIGLVGGGALGGIFGGVAYKPCDATGFAACMFSPPSRGAAVGFGMIVGGTVGGVAGLISGVFHVTDVWATPEAGVRVGLVPRGVGVSIALP